MNYLAHIFLSGSEEQLLVGNFIADAVKGRQAEQYPAGIAKGIYLHRLIDSYTDTHPVVAKTKARLRPHVRKYAPVVADMFYDHFLASRFGQYSVQPLPDFVQQAYNLISRHGQHLPPPMQHLFRHMREDNWLLSYAGLDGIGRALSGLSRRTTFASGMESASVELEANYSAYGQEFDLFFPELQAYVQQVLPNL